MTSNPTADLDALQRLADSGNDLSKSMVIDFFVDAPSEEMAIAVAERVRSRGFDGIEVSSGDDDRWTVSIPITMIPEVEEISYFQEVLDKDLAEFDAQTDGWGSFGNAEAQGES